MLRKIRVVLATIAILMVTLLFLDFTGVAQGLWGWMAKVQFVPAVLSLNLIVLASLVVLTLLLGRVYCSVICPLGVWQDVVAGIHSRRKKNRYRLSSAKTWLRLGILALFVVTIALGLTWIAALIEPYSVFGRMVASLIVPLYDGANNLLADWAAGNDSYMFYHVEARGWNMFVGTVAAISLIVVSVLAWVGGRTYCNTICPAGTILGYLAKYSWLKPVIDTEKCNKCGKCSRNCKASCIDFKEHKIDYSRCVACMDCIDVCSQKAIKYKHNVTKERKPEEAKTDAGRRTFMAIGAMVAGALAVKAQEKLTDGGLAAIIPKEKPQRTTPIAPPGALSLDNLADHCTSCQLCISNCPNGVLRPSTSLDSLMQPVVSYEKGYCRPECTRCSEVCPAGAITKITRAEKSAIQIGHAVWVKDRCLPAIKGTACGNCARHCPVGAITMIPSIPGDDSSAKIPAVNTERCIGCGACENLCPVSPISAIYVEGHERHRSV